ncbi:hypothetical protein [Rhodococcus qingshengii]|uniref:hypothetical protein n=1 Tax=Rhodococcus qingshengii TaxID=334542 RepID=UPI000C16D5C8|nr:hypothetical protein [Rhodococcus qingshengii]
MSSTEGNNAMSDTITVKADPEALEAARTRYSDSIKGDDHQEFVAAKVALVELWSGRTLDSEEIAYL